MQKDSSSDKVIEEKNWKGKTKISQISKLVKSKTTTNQFTGVEILDLLA